jgi:hypothetical protein
MTEEQIRKITEEGLDDKLVEDIIEAHPEWFAYDTSTIISDLQYALHDKLANVENGGWRENREMLEATYRNIARMYGLEIPSKKE